MNRSAKLNPTVKVALRPVEKNDTVSRGGPYAKERAQPAIRPLMTANQQQRSLPAKTLNGIPLPTKIFVGGIGESVLEGDVQDLFRKYAVVRSVRIITDRSIGLKNGEPRRYAFVEFADQTQVQKVLATCGRMDIELHGRRLNIGPAYRKPNTFNMTFGEAGQCNARPDGMKTGIQQVNTSPSRSNMGAMPQQAPLNGMYQQQMAAMQQVQSAYGCYPMNYPVQYNGYINPNVMQQYYSCGYGMQQPPYYGQQQMSYMQPAWTPSPQGSPPNLSPGIQQQGSPPQFDMENQPPQPAYYVQGNGGFYGYNMGQQAMPMYAQQNNYNRYGMQPADCSFG